MQRKRRRHGLRDVVACCAYVPHDGKKMIMENMTMTSSTGGAAEQDLEDLFSEGADLVEASRPARNVVTVRHRAISSLYSSTAPCQSSLLASTKANSRSPSSPTAASLPEATTPGVGLVWIKASRVALQCCFSETFAFPAALVDQSRGCLFPFCSSHRCILSSVRFPERFWSF